MSVLQQVTSYKNSRNFGPLNSSSSLPGIILMTLAVILFAWKDALAKLTGGYYSPILIIWAQVVFMFGIWFPILVYKYGWRWLIPKPLGWQVARCTSPRNSEASSLFPSCAAAAAAPAEEAAAEAQAAVDEKKAAITLSHSSHLCPCVTSQFEPLCMTASPHAPSP